MVQYIKHLKVDKNRIRITLTMRLQQDHMDAVLNLGVFMRYFSDFALALATSFAPRVF